MTPDGVFPMVYADLMRRLSDIHIHEDTGPEAEEVKRSGCRVIVRDMMGMGTPSVILRVEHENVIIQAAEIRDLLRKFGVSAMTFRNLG